MESEVIEVPTGPRGAGKWHREALAAGVLECVSKPVEPETLDQVLERFLGKDE